MTEDVVPSVEPVAEDHVESNDFVSHSERVQRDGVNDMRARAVAIDRVQAIVEFALDEPS